MFRVKSLSFLCLLFLLLADPGNAQTVSFTIDREEQAQKIHSVGASAVWFAEGIGKHWPDQKKEDIARLLFSKEQDDKGYYEGIGLSSFRFNIGGGTFEQGDSSGILRSTHRVESFLNPDGSYDWSKQAGYRYFVKKAKEYGVESLTAFANSAPVFFTENGLGFKTERDYTANLLPEFYDEYADFLATVVHHFENEGISFEFISPVNEPQWDWIGEFGNAKQEGSPWTNREIFKVINKLDSALTAKKLDTKILLPEAAMLTYLTGGSNHASNQIEMFFDPESELYLGELDHVPPVIAGHSYFTESTDSTTIAVRKTVDRVTDQYDIAFYQSEYSMLADGFREGTDRRRTAMECALFLAKIINRDFTIAEAEAWEFWNSFEPGSAEFDTRYYLIALQPNETYTDGEFTPTKNLWALGHYSQFIEPGMHRIETSRNDGLSELEVSQDVMISAFADEEELVLVVVNYTDEQRSVTFELDNFQNYTSIEKYVTTEDESLNLSPVPQNGLKTSLSPHSINTFVLSF